MKKYDITLVINNLNEFDAKIMLDKLMEGKETVLHPTTAHYLKVQLERILEK